MESKVPNTIRMSLAQRFNGRQLSQKGLISELRASAIRITDAFLKLCETKTTHELVLADVIQSLSNNRALKPPTGSSSDLRHQSKPPSSTDFIRHMYEPPSISKGKRRFAPMLESSSVFTDSLSAPELDTVPDRDQRSLRSHGDIIAWSTEPALSSHTWKHRSLKTTKSSIAFEDSYLQPKYANVDSKPLKRVISLESRQQCTKDVLAEHTRMWRQLAPKPIERKLSPNQQWHIELPKDYKPARPPFGIDTDGEESISCIHTEGIILHPPFGITRCYSDEDKQRLTRD